MDFDFTDDQNSLRDAVSRWVEKGFDFPRRHAIAKAGGATRAVYAELADLGLTGLAVPAAHGGMGFGAVEAMVVMEELGRGLINAPYAAGALVAPLHAWALRGPAIVASAHPADEEDDATLHQALRAGAFWLLTVCFLLHAFVSAALWAHVMPVFAAKGVAQADALTVLMTVGPAQVAGRLVYVWLGRGWSLRRLGAVVMAGLPLGVAVFAFAHSLPALLVFALVFGMSNGLVTIVRGGLVPLYFGRTHVGRIGGAMSGIGLLARAAAPLLTAWLLLALPGYDEVLLVLSGLGAVAVAAFWLARPPAG